MYFRDVFCILYFSSPQTGGTQQNQREKLQTSKQHIKRQDDFAEIGKL